MSEVVSFVVSDAAVEAAARELWRDKEEPYLGAARIPWNRTSEARRDDFRFVARKVLKAAAKASRGRGSASEGWEAVSDAERVVRDLLVELVEAKRFHDAEMLVDACPTLHDLLWVNLGGWSGEDVRRATHGEFDLSE